MAKNKKDKDLDVKNELVDIDDSTGEVKNVYKKIKLSNKQIERKLGKGGATFFRVKTKVNGIEMSFTLPEQFVNISITLVGVLSKVEITLCEQFDYELSKFNEETNEFEAENITGVELIKSFSK